MALQHFIVPLDFSAYSDRALDYAMGLAKQLQARLTLLHVIYMPKLGEVELNSYIADLEAESRRFLLIVTPPVSMGRSAISEAILAMS